MEAQGIQVGKPLFWERHGSDPAVEIHGVDDAFQQFLGSFIGGGGQFLQQRKLTDDLLLEGTAVVACGGMGVEQRLRPFWVVSVQCPQ
jgi:hypothetical protein